MSPVSERAPVMKSLVAFPVVAFLLLCSTPPAQPATRSDDKAAPSPARASEDAAPSAEMIAIPGPTRSFLRMAAISEKVSPDEITPLLARNVYLLGYEGPQSQAHQTE